MPSPKLDYRKIAIKNDTSESNAIREANKLAVDNIDTSGDTRIRTNPYSNLSSNQVKAIKEREAGRLTAEKEYEELIESDINNNNVNARVSELVRQHLRSKNPIKEGELRKYTDAIVRLNEVNRKVKDVEEDIKRGEFVTKAVNIGAKILNEQELTPEEALYEKATTKIANQIHNEREASRALNSFVQKELLKKLNSSIETSV